MGESLNVWIKRLLMIDAEENMFFLLLSALPHLTIASPSPFCHSAEPLPQPSPSSPDLQYEQWSQIDCAVFYNCYEKVFSTMTMIFIWFCDACRCITLQPCQGNVFGRNNFLDKYENSAQESPEINRYTCNFQEPGGDCVWLVINECGACPLVKPAIKKWIWPLSVVAEDFRATS